MKILDANSKELMKVSSLSRDGNSLVIKGKIFGAMPMVAKLTPEEARAALKLLDFKTVWFLLTILFLKTPPKVKK